MKKLFLMVPALAFAAGCANNDRYVTQSDAITSPYYGPASAGGTDVLYEQRTDNDIVRVEPSTPVIVGATTEPSPETARHYIITPVGNGATTITYDANGISYDTAAPARDAELTTSVQRSLYSDPAIVAIAPAVQVNCEAGKVILNGKVHDDQERMAIERRVRATTGVVAINNQIQVAYPPTGRAGEPHIYSNATDHVIYGRNGVDVVVPSPTGRSENAAAVTQSTAPAASADAGVQSQQSAVSVAEQAAQQNATIGGNASAPQSTEAASQLNNSTQTSGSAQLAGSVDSQTHALQNRDLKATSDSTATRNYEQTGSPSVSAPAGKDTQNPNPEERKDLQTDAAGGATVTGSASSSGAGVSAPPSPQSQTTSGESPSAGGSAAVPAQDFSTGAKSPAAGSGQNQSSAATQPAAAASGQNDLPTTPQTGGQNSASGTAGNSVGAPASQASSVSSSAAGTTASGESSADLKTESGQGSTTDRPQSSLSGLSTGASASDTAAKSVTVQSATDSDHAAGEQISQQLKTEPQLAPVLPMVRVSIVNGKATLTGTVKTEAQKQQIQSKVQQVTGISSVENSLRVGVSSGTSQ